MIDLNLLREHPAKTKESILRKEPSFPVDQLINHEQAVRCLRQEVEQLRKDKNNLASQGAKGITPEVREQSIALGKELKAKEAALSEQEETFKKLWLTCPNIPQDDLPLGNKEANKPVKVVGLVAEVTIPLAFTLTLV